MDQPLNTHLDDGHPRPRPTWRFLIGLMIALSVIQVALYAESFHVKPAGDDFGVPLTEIHRGNADGPLAFFTTSVHPKDYRPLLALIEWACCRGTMPEPWLAIHLMHFACMFVYGLCVITWLRVLPLGRVGATVAASLSYLHPIMVSQVGGMDGFGGLLSIACMWWGVLTVYLHRDHPWRAAALAGAWFVVAMLLKEYSLGMPLLAALVPVVFPTRRRILLFAALVVVLAPITLGLLEIKNHIQLPGQVAETPEINLWPWHVATNTGMLGTALLYFGHAAWVLIDRGVFNLVLFAVSSALSIALISAGLWRGLRKENDSHATAFSTSSTASTTIRRWIVFLLLCLVPSAFPANVLPSHPAEMYAIGMVMPFTLLAGFAADQWRSASRPWRTIASLAFVLQLAFGGFSVVSKVSELRRLGDRADHMLDQLDEIVPADARDQTIAVVYLAADLTPGSNYSVYRQNDDNLLLPGSDLPYDGAMAWRRPGRGLGILPIVVENIEDANLAPFRLAYRWNAATRTFSALKTGS